MVWPPNKAWTSKTSRNGFSHFVAINYGGEDSDRWVDLISVLDGDVTIKASWFEMQDISLWISGWHELKPIKNERNENVTICKHPSLDSGLTIPLFIKRIRPWFSD